jgi:hypothetical protein
MPTLRQQLLGVWKLVSYQERPLDGSQPYYPMGDAPQGIIIYSPHGYMSAQLMKPDRKLFASGNWLTGTPDEYREEAANYVAYSGEFHVDEDAGIVHHSMFVSLFPTWVGQTQARVVDLSGDTLRLAPTEHLLSNGKTVTVRLTWKRAMPA